MTILAEGQIPTTKTTIFEVGETDVLDTLSARIEKITLFNTSTVAQTASLYIKERFGTSKKLRQFILQQNEGGEYLEPGEFLLLNIRDAIEAETTTDAVVDFTVFGERF